MKKLRFPGLLGSLTLILAFTTSQLSLAESPAWALGEQPNFSGVIENWDEDSTDSEPRKDALTPIRSSDTQDYSEVVPLGSGEIAADGSFTFQLDGNATDDDETLGLFRGCLNATDPELKIVVAELHPVEPSMWLAGNTEVILLSSQAVPLYGSSDYSPTSKEYFENPLPEQSRQDYYFVYTNKDVTYQGVCEVLDFGLITQATLDLELYKGWNSIRVDTDGLTKQGYTTAPVPSDAKWYYTLLF